MKSTVVILSLFLMLGFGSYVFADDRKTDQGSRMSQGMMQQEDKKGASTVVEVGNKICPVSGQKVGQMGEIVKYEYNGKIYNLCCPACKKDFGKNPEKYSKIAEDEVKNQK